MADLLINGESIKALESTKAFLRHKQDLENYYSRLADEARR